jgi:hypothetical protein
MNRQQEASKGCAKRHVLETVESVDALVDALAHNN